MKGWPDYVRTTGLVENYDEFAQNYPVGIGDGAARLGSIKTYDMRGRAIFMDDFEAAVLKWQTVNAGVGGSQAIDTLHARNGNQSCRLTTNTGAGRQSQIERSVPQPRQQRVGLEASFYTPTDFEIFEMLLVSYDGTDTIFAGVRLVEATRTIEYLDDIGAWINSGFTWDHTDVYGLFNTAKIVIDYKQNEYTRLLYNHQELNMTGIATWTFGWAIDPSIRMILNAEGDNINNIACYADDVILTTMEPE